MYSDVDMPTMRVWFDTEFEEAPDGRIALISIGMVREDGKTFYADAAEYNGALAPDWLKKNVIPCRFGPSLLKCDMRLGILEFLSDVIPEFWAEWGGYDWVLLCQIFGGLFSFPDHWPVYFNEVRQATRDTNIHVPFVGTKHNALADAQHSKKAHLTFESKVVVRHG